MDLCILSQSEDIYLLIREHSNKLLRKRRSIQPNSQILHKKTPIQSQIRRQTSISDTTVKCMEEESYEDEGEGGWVKER